jgi:hypothetical protein
MPIHFLGNIVLLTSLNFVFLSVSPFHIDYPQKKEVTFQDYENIDALLDSCIINKRLEEMYVLEKVLFGSNDDVIFHNFYGAVLDRMLIASRMRLTDPLRNEKPVKNLVQINRGGKNVVVSCVGFGKRRPKDLLKNLQTSLEKSGFDGFFYYRIGGFPTPRGVELNLCATPYAFKIFMMEEAKNLGFENILWLDARLQALKNITPLFSIIQDNGGLFNLTHSMERDKVFILAQKALFDLTQTAYQKNRALSTPVLGLKMNHPKIEKIIDGFYEACFMGTPFFSCYPEEIVLAALIQKHFSDAIFLNQKYPQIWEKLYLYSPNAKMDKKLAVFSKKKSFFFFGVSNEGIDLPTL